MISDGFLNLFWNDADKRRFFEHFPKQRRSPMAFSTFSETELTRAGFFKSILKQRWSALVVLKPFWTGAGQHWFLYSHSTITLNRAGFQKPILKQRWSAFFFKKHSEAAVISDGFLNLFWKDAEKRWFFEPIPKQHWWAVVFQTHSETALMRSGFFQTHSDTAMIRARCFKSILNQRWSALVSLISF